MSVELQGLPAAPGLAKGLSLRVEQQPLQIPKFSPVDIPLEKKRLGDARQEAIAQLHRLVDQITKQIGASEAALFEAQAMFLDDPALVQRTEAAIEAGINAEQAWHEACEYFARQLEALPDETLRARSTDMRDAGRRALEILSGTQATTELAQPGVILARDLAPSQTVLLDKSKVLAFCIAEGGPTSHTAILAKALGIPAVVGLGDTLMNIPDETFLLVDGDAGAVISNPTSDRIVDFEQRILISDEKRQREQELAGQPAVTRDGHRVEIVANVGSVDDARLALQFGAEGIGLLRTEFLFLNRSQPPDEHTQYSAYRTILDLMGKNPVVARTLDIGGDKEVPYLDFGHEANPFLGYRAIRISLDHPQAFKTQLQALLRAGADHDLRIMFPMIASLDEVRQAKSLVANAQAELRKAGKKMAENIQIGIMVEVPSVTILAKRFAREVDFFSIGTNDLTQYTLAAERGNARVSRLNDPCHPAVLAQIQQVVKAARQADIWVGVCGEMAGDIQAIPILLGLGVDELSMSPRQIPAAKQVVREWRLVDAQKLASRALRKDNATAVRHLVLEQKLKRSS